MEWKVSTKTKGENGLGAAKYRDAGKRGGRKGNSPPPVLVNQLSLFQPGGRLCPSYNYLPLRFFRGSTASEIHSAKKGDAPYRVVMYNGSNYFSGSFFTCIQ